MYKSIIECKIIYKYNEMFVPLKVNDKLGNTTE